MISENIQSERQDCIWETKNEGLKSSRSMIKLISNIVLENHWHLNLFFRSWTIDNEFWFATCFCCSVLWTSFILVLNSNSNVLFRMQSLSISLYDPRFDCCITFRYPILLIDHILYCFVKNYFFSFFLFFFCYWTFIKIPPFIMFKFILFVIFVLFQFPNYCIKKFQLQQFTTS